MASPSWIPDNFTNLTPAKPADKTALFQPETISVLSGFTATPNSNQTLTLHFSRQTVSQYTLRTAWIITSWILAWLSGNGEANKGGSGSAFDSFLCRPDRACRADGFRHGSNRLDLSSLHKGKGSEELLGGKRRRLTQQDRREQQAENDAWHTSHMEPTLPDIMWFHYHHPGVHAQHQDLFYYYYYHLETEISLILYRVYSNAHKTIFHMIYLQLFSR